MLETIFATLSLGGRRILDRVSVQLNAGEVVALIGPNGAGKSTLLKVLSGELKAERGRVALHGCPLNAWKPRELARYRAVLPQGAGLDFSFSVLEVVLLGRSPHLLNLASQYADRILLLSAGRLLASGPPEHVFTPLTIAQGFGIRAVVLPHPDGFPVILPRGTAVSLNHLSIPLL